MSVTNKMMDKFEKKYDKDSHNKLIQGAIANVGIHASTINLDVKNKHTFKFTYTTKRGSITNQKSSGRCWIFAALNVARVNVMKNLNINDFEFSENYVMFWDKMEKANTFLEYIRENIDLELSDRKLDRILYGTIDDGGYWEMLTGLVKKYGAVPKECMPETFHSSSTHFFDEYMDVRLRKAASEMRNAHKEGKDKEIDKIVEDALYSVYNICVKALGKPPKTVEYQYTPEAEKEDAKKSSKKEVKYDARDTRTRGMNTSMEVKKEDTKETSKKDKKEEPKLKKISGITPVEFFEKYVGNEFLEKVDLLTDPRGIYPYGKVLELPLSKSVYEEANSSFINVPMEELKKATIKSIKAGEPVWFACDVGKSGDNKEGILDSDLYNLEEALTPLGEFSKADRLIYKNSFLTHAMAFVGVELDEKGNPLYWEVENSWGGDVGKDGIYSMSDKWFDDHNYSVIVDKKYVTKKYLKALEEEPIILEIWDPLS